MILKTVSRYRGTQRLLVAIFFLAGFVYVSGPFLATVSMGAVISIVLAPLFRKLLNRGWSARWASALLTLGVTLTVLIPASAIVVFGGRAAFEQLQSLNIERYGSLAGLAENPRFQKVVFKLTDWMNLPQDTVFDGVRKALVQITTFFSGVFGDLVYQLPEIFLSLIAMILAIYYFLSEGQNLLKFLRDNSPFSKESTIRIFEAVENASFSVIVATLLSATAQTTIMLTGAFFAQTPNLQLVGLFTFLCAFLPVVGTTPMSAGLIIYHMSLNHVASTVVMIATAIVVSLIDNLIHLVVLKNRSHLHPLLGFIAVFGGLRMIGLTGLFLGPIVAALAVAIIPILLREQRAEVLSLPNDTPSQILARPNNPALNSKSSSSAY